MGTKADCEVVEVTADTVLQVDRDSMGSWDELRQHGGAFSGFAPWIGAAPRRPVN